MFIERSDKSSLGQRARFVANCSFFFLLFYKTWVDKKGGKGGERRSGSSTLFPNLPLSLSFSVSNPLNKFVRRRKFDERRHETRSIPSIYDRPLRRYLFVYGSTETRSIRLFRARNATRRAATVYRIYIPWDDPLQSCDLIVCEILMVGMENIGTKLEEPRC